MHESYSETNYSSRHLISNRIADSDTFPPMADDVQRIVRGLLEATGLTQGAFAKKVGTSQGTVSKWLSGEHTPNLKQWNRVMRFAEGTPKSRHVVDSADALLVGLESADREGAMAVLRAHLATITKRKGAAA